MRQITSFILSLVIFSNVFGQTMVDSLVYKKGVNMLLASRSPLDYRVSGKYFDSLASSRPDEWLASVYAGLSFVLASYNESDGDMKDLYLDTAQVYLDRAAARDADESELASVQAFLYQARIDVSPMERGLEYSRKAGEEIKKAEAANPDDPRPYFLYGMNIYYTPRIFGGGADKALPFFEEAAERYKDFTPQLPFMLNWGEQQNLEMVEKCKKE